MVKAIICDVESTGLTDPQVVEYGAQPIELDGERVFPIGPLTEMRFGATKPMDWGAVATHGITPDQLEGLPTFSLEAVGFDCEYLIGQNIDYDWSAIGKPDVKRIDTLCLARKAWPDLDSHKLMALVAFLDIDAFKGFFASAHSVATDIRATGFVLDRLLQIYKPTDMEGLWQISEDARIPEIMSFSKDWKGKPVSAVDTGFRNWYRRLPDPDPYVLKAFDKYPYARQG